MAIPEASLFDAISNCFVDLLPSAQTVVVANSTRTKTLAFCTLVKNTFPADQISAYPVADLIAVLAAQTTSVPALNGTNITFPTDFSKIVFTLCKVLWMSFVLSDSDFGPPQISAAQANAVLAAFNTAYA